MLKLRTPLSDGKRGYRPHQPLPLPPVEGLPVNVALDPHTLYMALCWFSIGESHTGANRTRNVAYRNTIILFEYRESYPTSLLKLSPRPRYTSLGSCTIGHFVLHFTLRL